MLWLVTAALLLAQTSGALPPKPPAVRLHHVHVVVPDPAAAMRKVTDRVDGSVRTILQGHGPGVRTDGQYIVFDRETIAAPPLRACDVSVRAAVAWLSSSGVGVSELGSSMASAIRDATCSTVAFATEQSSDLVEHLRARGVAPSGHGDSGAQYSLASELTVEILDDPDRPDTHWCPMHPDVRAPRPGTCPRCKMDLVPIPSPQVGEYGLDVTMGVAVEGQLLFRFVVTEPASARPVTQFVEAHERLFHLFIISTDLERFAHVHPERQPDGSFVLTQALAPGEYMLMADVLPQGGTPQMLQRAIVTPGYSGPLFAAPPRLAPTPLEQRAGDLMVRLSVPKLTELRPTSLSFDIIDLATGRAAAGLEPYLGAAAHLLVVDDALQLPLHAHPEQATSLTGTGGVDFDLRFPTAGVYKMWFQFQRNGQVQTIPFVVRVAPL
jgi:Heavy metal binding domain